MAADVFGSVDAARDYLRTPNFALGGATPRDFLKTTEGEQVVISELQTQAEGGPVRRSFALTHGLASGNETRARDPDLGKVVLYGLSNSRNRKQIWER